MSKPPRPSYADMLDLPHDPVDAPAAAEPETMAEAATVTVAAPKPVTEPVKSALKDGTPTAYRPDRAKAERPKPARAKAAPAIPSRREAARLRRQEPKPEPADYAQRSLYAREETFERFRQLAFSNKTTAQALYREGLFLVLQKYKQADGLEVEDM